ncbi:uncharacterized protein LOC143422147 [Xylocopa sonorina]|uniref:uncharacterized protein LOC143422147 n=1 Tax=Xylocopa sonorina TaxID=1818115 RepID=UPI00403B258F
MKSIILFCLLMVVCNAQIFPPTNILQQATQAIKNAKSSVDDVMSEMERTRRTLVMNTERQMYNYRSQSATIIIDLKDLRMKDIKEKQAQAPGKDAQDCLNKVQSNVMTSSTTGMNDLDRCQNTAKQQFQNELQAFDTAKATGEKLKSDLDRISLECYTSNVFDMANCIFSKVGLANINIRNYKQQVAQMERQAESNKNTILLQQSSCNNAAVSKAREGFTTAIYDAAKCLKN